MTKSKDGVPNYARAMLPPGIMISGGKVEGFTEGWALVQGTWGKAHYFIRPELGLAKSICGSVTVPAALLLHQGDFVRCATCQRKRSDARKAGRK